MDTIPIADGVGAVVTFVPGAPGVSGSARVWGDASEIEVCIDLSYEGTGLYPGNPGATWHHGIGYGCNVASPPAPEGSPAPAGP